MKADTEILSGFYHSVNGFQKTDKKILKTVERLKIPVYNGRMEKGVNNMIEAIDGFRLPRYAQIPDVGLYLEQVVRYVNTHLAPLGEPELTSSMVSNYVKQGLISSPIKKSYTAEHLSRLLFIAVVKPVVPLEGLRMMFSICQRQSEIVRKRRRNFVVFRRGGVTKIRCFLAQKECSRFAVSGA